MGKLSLRKNAELIALIFSLAISDVIADTDISSKENSIEHPVTQLLSEEHRPILNLRPIINIVTDENENRPPLLLHYYNIVDIKNRLPVPDSDYFAWQNTLLLNIPPIAKINFKEIICRRLHLKLNDICEKLTFHETGRRSEELNALGYIDVLNKDINSPKDPVKVMIVAGTHGNEPSSVQLTMHWLSSIVDHKVPDIYWRIIPALNPDGLLAIPRKRTNARGVDLNRNMPTLDWQTDAMKSWINRSNSLERFYPGKSAASEAETRFLVEQIEYFEPDIIVSVHAPYNLVDYDHSSVLFAPPNIGLLRLRRLGSFPGSLGRYTGFEREIPTVTIELDDAMHSPNKEEYKDMLSDLVYWINATNEHTPVITMPSTEKRRMIAQNLKRQREQAAAAAEKQARQYEIQEHRIEENFISLPVVSQPYIIEDPKKIDVVPVIL